MNMGAQIYRAVLGYVIGLTILAFAGGLAVGSCYGRPSDAVADSLTASANQQRSIVQATRAELEIIRVERDSLTRIASASSGRVQVIEIESRIFVDTTLPAPKTTTGTTMDTVAWAWVKRQQDTTHYPAPLFFVQVYEATRDAWVNERRLRVYDSTYTIPMKDTLNVQLWALTKTQGREIELWKEKANPKCGRGCGIALGVLGSVSAAIAANQFGRLGRG